jgi:hypothetical protein
MPALSKRVVGMLPMLALLAACSNYPPASTTSVPPPSATVTPTAPLAGTTVPPPAVATTTSAPVRLTSAQITSLLANNTAVGVSQSGQPYAVYFTSDGRAHFRGGAAGDVTDTGTWRVLPDGQLCSRLPHVSNGAEECYILSRTGNVTLFHRLDGVAIGSFRVLSGNIENL